MFLVEREVARYCTADFLAEVDPLLIVARLKLLELATLIVIQSPDTVMHVIWREGAKCLTVRGETRLR
jgi:hypothetical protein